jgi:hypothetical protein
MSALADWRSELNSQLPESERRGLIDTLSPAANQGAEAVEKEFAARLRQEIAPALEESQEDLE